MKKVVLLIFILHLCGCSTYSSHNQRGPASFSSDDPCHEAMRSYFSRLDLSTAESDFVDDIIDLNRLVDSGKISREEISEIGNSSEWSQFFNAKNFDASEEEQVLVAALLRKSDPDAPVEALQRKYGLLFEFCGL